MLVILAPEEIPKYWDEVKYYIESSLPIHQQYGYSMPEILTGYSERILTKEEMEDMITSIKKLAESKGCKSILFYTDIKNSIQMFKEVGATLHGHLIMEV